jgi:hypothetical protein
MKSSEGRNWFSKNNPSHNFVLNRHRSKQQKTLARKGKHNFQNRELQEKNKSRFFDMLIHNNPMHNEQTKNKVRMAVMVQIENGTHNSQIKMECPHCGKCSSIPNSKRWHFDNCKSKVI